MKVYCVHEMYGGHEVLFPEMIFEDEGDAKEWIAEKLAAHVEHTQYNTKPSYDIEAVEVVPRKQGANNDQE